MNPTNPEVETSMADFLRNQQERERLIREEQERERLTLEAEEMSRQRQQELEERQRSLNRNEENLLRDTFGSLDRVDPSPRGGSSLHRHGSTSRGSSYDPDVEKLKTILDTVNTLASVRPDPYR